MYLYQKSAESEKGNLEDAYFITNNGKVICDLPLRDEAKALLLIGALNENVVEPCHITDIVADMYYSAYLHSDFETNFTDNSQDSFL